MRESLSTSDTGEKERLFTGNFVLLAAMNFALLCSFQLFLSALPLYASGLGVSDGRLGWATAMVTFSAIAVRPLAGWMLDRFGRKGVLVAGVAVLAASTALLAGAPAFGAILAVRFLQGVAWGVCNTGANTVASDVVPKGRFAEGMGYFSLTVSLALAVAPAIGLELLQRLGIGAIVGLSVVLASACLVMSLLLKYPRIDAPAAPLSAKSLFEKRTALPSAITAFVTFAYGGTATFLALLAQERSIGGVGLFFAFYAVTTVISRPPIGKMVDRRGYAPAVYLGLALVALSMAAIALASGIVELLAAAVVYGMGMGCCLSALQAMAVASCPPQRRGAANALFLVGFDSGVGVGSIAAGLVAAGLGYTGLFAALAALPVAAAAVFAVALRRAIKRPSRNAHIS